MNKKLLMGLVVLGCMGLVTAAWLFTISGGFTAVVESLPGYANLDLDITSLSVNTTEGSDSASVETTFLLNKDMTLNVRIIETIQDNSGGECLEYENDCEMYYEVEDRPDHFIRINDSNVIDLVAMPYPRNLTATLNCEAYSCPQSRSAEITLTQIQ